MAGHDFSMSFPGLMKAVLEFVAQLPGRTEAEIRASTCLGLRSKDTQAPHFEWYKYGMLCIRGH